MKFSLKVFKKGKPIYWVLGGIVIFVLFYLMFSRGSGGGGGTVAVQSGPSEALQIASMQAGQQTAQLQAQVNMEANRTAAELALGQLAGQIQLAQLTSGEAIAKAQLEQNAILQMAAFDTQKQMASWQMEYGLESARIASDTALTAKQMDTALLMQQMQTNKEMFQIQSENLITQTIISQIPNLKKKDRDEAFSAVLKTQLVAPGATYQDRFGSISYPLLT